MAAQEYVDTAVALIRPRHADRPGPGEGGSDTVGEVLGARPARDHSEVPGRHDPGHRRQARRHDDRCPGRSASQNLFGVESRWLTETGGSGMRATSAARVHASSSSGWSAGSVRWRPANRGSSSRATFPRSRGRSRGPRSRSRAREDGLRRLVETEPRAEPALEQDDRVVDPTPGPRRGRDPAPTAGTVRGLRIIRDDDRAAPPAPPADRRAPR